ncbi:MULTISPECIES: site-specific DNA-methyltransferase [Bizionia]|uniref:site-specific DNA-methyltransferase (adenine-specific) n=1 Tax=Bizionia algoritergicola TaxID=291187 RepID=A0A5D0R2C5_9FLAO|nr:MULTISPECIES: site-specific DNA-methyltransferase [Bizionia]OBX24224.1 type III restriction endonuclease subunit M [Bizionia sp. APA-3]TYB75145.1 site-specific DNA-methyltransferase [Bizionia algoritergicola]
MPTLNWIGKEKVINHHQDVPFKTLEPQYTFANGKETNDTSSDNKIIHGDNLEALKSLLPEYEGKVDCIYIDPPYNTGNEGWVYNDNVSDPKLKKWLGQVVGKESEDLSRHDKWLCMMYPRLKLLQKLLSFKGVIFISIDDSEYGHLKTICDEIFGHSNYMSTFVWKRRSSSQLSQNNISVDHEYILCYSRFKQQVIRGEDKDYKGYTNPDNDPNGPWVLGDLTVGMTKSQRPNQFYDLINPKNGMVFPASESRVWAYIPESMEERIKSGRVYFPDDSSKRPMTKRFLSDLKSTINPVSTWIEKPTTKNRKLKLVSGLNTEGTKALNEIFGNKVFDYSKPISLIESLIYQTTDDNSIVLDSFSGSGTTAHAVLNLNKEDNANRKFILVEMEDYANTITAERVKRVINGYGEDKKVVEGTGGDFTYYELGQPLFLDDGFLNEEIELDKILEYVWYSEAKQPFKKPKEAYLLGAKNGTACYFYYQNDSMTTLDESFLRSIKTKASQYIIYADNCLLDQTIMDKYNIVFKKIPRDITRF